MKKILALLMVLLMALSFAACAKESAPTPPPAGGDASSSGGDAGTAAGLSKNYSFNVGSSSTEGTTITKTFEYVQKQAPAASDGKLEMNYYGSSSLGSDKELVVECVNGNVPIIVLTTASLTSTVPELAIFDMHCALPSLEVLDKLLADPEFFEIYSGWYEKAGLKLLMWDSTASKLLATTRKVTSVADFQKYDMRTLDNKYHMAFWQAVGANTIQIVASELYLSVQQGLINGIEMNMASILSRKLTEVCPVVEETMILPHMTIAVMNLNAYNSLPDADRAWFDSFIDEMNAKFREIGTEDNAGGWEKVKAEGCEAVMFKDIEPMFNDLREIAKTSSWAKVREDLGDEIVDSYLNKIDQYNS